MVPREMKFELKKFKYFPSGSNDSTCFTADLYVNGVLTAYLHDDGWGGCINMDPAGRTDIQRQENRRMLQVAEAWVKANIPGETVTVTVELPPADLVDPATAQAQYDEMGIKAGSTSTAVLPMSMELYVGEMVEKLIREQLAKKDAVRFRRQCRTKTLFNLPGDKEGNYHTYDRPFGPRMVVFMKEKHPDADIWNYKYGGVLSAADEQKQLDAIRDREWKKLCKTKTLFRLDDGKVYQNAGHYGYTTRMQLQLMYGDRLVEIINDRLDPLPDVTDMIALYRLVYTETRIPAQWIVGPVYYVTPDDLGNYEDIPNHVRYTTDFEEVKRLWAADHPARE